MTALADMTWPEVDRSGILAVPLGSTEQHGPHLPLSTDLDVASELCRRLATARHDVVVAPGLPYGSSGEHAAFPGTLSIGRAALELVVVELVRSAGFARIVLVNGHGGNAAPLAAAEARCRAESRDVLVHTPRIAGGDAHAGHSETSLLLALGRPVGDADSVVGNAAPLAELLPALQAGRLAELSPSGVLGAPAGASRAEGLRLWDVLSTDLVAAADARWPR